jgi:hypothetical protein
LWRIRFSPASSLRSRCARVASGRARIGAAPEARVHRPEQQHVADADGRQRGVADHVDAFGGIAGRCRGDAQPDGRAGVHGQPAPEPDLGVQPMRIEAVVDDGQAALDFGAGQL